GAMAHRQSGARPQDASLSVRSRQLGTPGGRSAARPNRGRLAQACSPAAPCSLEWKEELVNQNELDQLCITTIRFLAVDTVQNANSGHPGMPLDAAPMAYVLAMRFIRRNPADPGFIDRDRFVLSSGHASALLYSIQHLTGYPAMTLEQLKRFRQWHSLTPGHP